jgi:cation transport ATPase
MTSVSEHKLNATDATAQGEHIKLDKAAIGVSALCVVHCLSVPLLVVFSPSLNLWLWGSEGFHLLLLAIVVPLSLIAFRRGFLHHRNLSLLWPGLIGLAIIVLAALLEIAVIGHEMAALLTTFGGIGLIISHWRNMRACGCRHGA